jgi:hypothetical protein
LGNDRRPPRRALDPNIFDVEPYIGQHYAEPIEPTTQRLSIVTRPAQRMIAS